MKEPRRAAGVVAIAAALALGLVPTVMAQDAPEMLTEIGPGEGQLSILSWPGYVERGDSGVDWVTDFEAETGCAVTADIFGTSDEAWTKFTSGGYDVVSASGDLSYRLFENGFVQPVNVDLIESYPDIVPALKDQPYNTFDGVHYGAPHGRGANLLMWRTDLVDPAPTSWAEVFAADSPYAGKITAYDAAIYIADAAVVLMSTNPELGITNPYALDETQFQAAVDLARQQQPILRNYWSDAAAQMADFRNGDVVLGTTWQIVTNYLLAEDPPVAVDNIKPVEGSTGWSDTWMIAADTPNVNCAYLWLNHITSAPVQAELTEWWGEAPGNAAACELMQSPTFCDEFHAAPDDPFWDDVWYWTTPREQCVDLRTDVQCVGFDRWLDAWLEIKGG
jgi:putative spermidine/putrescine transport system substrate-binding protein